MPPLLRLWDELRPFCARGAGKEEARPLVLSALRALARAAGEAKVRRAVTDHPRKVERTRAEEVPRPGWATRADGRIRMARINVRFFISSPVAILV
jgi:hypothetical protein